jgi:hypothetical protein
MVKGTRARRQSRPVPALPPNEPQAVTVVEPKWVTSMHDHYQRTGLFRAADLDRVLGDPRKQVSGETLPDVVACRLATAK